ncbi:hypothetical protein TSAR_015003 [Trichomalopsis sarcophagae]|uniref:Uncharacterized protein n=1 Tax=Trichomalopsis sarcophagae TaxID=543379 RepID=A0A232FC69_9HYME|nr:hypothetical protein TSAR_015003 [Trichomalopsis sarcophagae]
MRLEYGMKITQDCTTICTFIKFYLKDVYLQDVYRRFYMMRLLGFERRARAITFLFHLSTTSTIIHGTKAALERDLQLHCFT